MTDERLDYWEWESKSASGQKGIFRIVHEMVGGKPKCRGPLGRDPFHPGEPWSPLLLSVSCVFCSTGENFEQNQEEYPSLRSIEVKVQS